MTSTFSASEESEKSEESEEEEDDENDENPCARCFENNRPDLVSEYNVSCY